MGIKYHSVTVLSCEDGQTFQTRANEMEQPNSCMISGLRVASVRIILRDDATLCEINMALEAVRANLNELLDTLPAKGGGGGYIP